MFSKRAVVLACLLGLVVTACGDRPDVTSQTPAATTPSATTPSAGSTTSANAPAAPVAEKLRFTAKTIDGTDFSGSDLAGKPAVLWFWAPWCPKCQREAPGMAKAAAELGSSVTFVGVAALDQVPAMRGFVDKYGLKSFQHIADTESAVWQRFGVTAQPAYAFIDRAGEVEVVTRQLSEQDLRDRLGELA